MNFFYVGRLPGYFKSNKHTQTLVASLLVSTQQSFSLPNPQPTLACPPTPFPRPDLEGTPVCHVTHQVNTCRSILHHNTPTSQQTPPYRPSQTTERSTYIAHHKSSRDQTKGKGHFPTKYQVPPRSASKSSQLRASMLHHFKRPAQDCLDPVNSMVGHVQRPQKIPGTPIGAELTQPQPHEHTYQRRIAQNGLCATIEDTGQPLVVWEVWEHYPHDPRVPCGRSRAGSDVPTLG